MNLHRRTFSHCAGAVGLGALLPASGLQAQTTTASGARPAAEAIIGAALRERAQHEGMGFAAAVANRDGVQLAFAGKRAATDTAGPDANALFEYGSITKTFTALLLADAVVQKRLALDDAVEAALGQKLRDSEGKPITWLDLATHRSGLPRLPDNFRPSRAADPYADYDEARLKAFIEAWKPQVPRQSRWEYSNLGFGLLGHALGRQAGKPYAELMRDRILLPLGLGELRVAIPSDASSGLLIGHDAKNQPVPRWTFDTLAGAGALIGSAASLARYAQAALGLIETPLKAAFELSMTRHAEGGKPGNPAGLGWVLGTLNGRRIAAHDGGTFGFSSSLFLDLDQRRAALVLANASVPVTDLALHALDPGMPLRNAAADKQQTQREAVPLPAAAMEPLAGIYALNPQFKVTIRMREGRLFAQATAQGEFELFALEPRKFFARVTALEMQFEGDSGPPPAMLLLQGGQRLRFVRE